MIFDRHQVAEILCCVPGHVAHLARKAGVKTLVRGHYTLEQVNQMHNLQDRRRKQASDEFSPMKSDR